MSEPSYKGTGMSVFVGDRSEPSYKGAREIGAACVASTASPLCLNWTDLVKTRMQGIPAKGSITQPYIGGFTTVARRILAEEGVFFLWTTALPVSLLREGLAVGSRIGAYPMVRDAVSSVSGGGQGSASTGLATKLGTGVLLGAVSGILTTPCDLVRIRFQYESGKVHAQTNELLTGFRAGLQRQLYSSPGGFLFVARGGLMNLFHGVGVNVVRSVCTTVSTMPVYDQTKHLAKTYYDAHDGPLLHFGAGIVCGLSGTTFTAPSDIIRTRIMASTGESVLGAVRGVWREQGLRGFFRGWLPAYMRLGPLFLCMPALVEQSRSRIFGLGYMK